jgi:hypothetical protein
MDSESKREGAVPYLLSIGLGSLLAQTAPSWLLLPAFLGCAGSIIVLTVASYTLRAPTDWSVGLRLALFVLGLLGLVPVGLDVNNGPAPRLLGMAVLFMLGLVLVLALGPGAV